ncbi:MAG: extracellular solute-binding protein [Candidatus Methanoperedens sp.]|nr:extracellular solute-binding protein [Candidatus Methanoperedens sp.]
MLWSCILFIFVALILPGHIQASPSPAASKTKASGTAAAAGQNWDAILNEAKKEGMVVVYNTAWTSQVRVALSQAFKEKYGINLEFSPFSRGAELVAKVQAEQRSGLFLADFFGAGGGTLLTSLKPTGYLGSMEPLLVLSEVTDGKYWRDGKFPYLDKDKTAVGMLASVQRNIIYNTNLIKKGEITTYKDLLKPQYRGKITVNDPTVSGSGKEVFLHLSLNIWNVEEAKAYLTQLLKQQEAVVERDNRQHVESVARGKYAIGLGPNPDNLAEFIKNGAPIDAVVLKEGVYVSGAAGCIGAPTKLAHPNAARIFINWLLGKEGQTVFANSFGNPSMRSDVSTAQFNPIFIPQAREKVFMANETSILFTDDVTKITKQIMDEVYKK